MDEDRDLIGPWSEVKLDILREYVGPYSRILKARGFYHLFVDAFAGPGEHRSRISGNVVPGSPLLALNVDPPFSEYHFIEKNPERVGRLQKITMRRSDVHIHQGDCNEVLLHEVFPRARYKDRRRALCLLDPYNADLSWEVVLTAGQMKSVEIFVNFMVMDMNMNVLLRDAERANPDQIARMNRFWGDESWRQVTYEESPQLTLSGVPQIVKVEDANAKIAEAYRQRLRNVAGFQYAPRPLPFLNTIRRTIYYLFFASQNAVGSGIVTDIFEKYRRRQQLP